MHSIFTPKHLECDHMIVNKIIEQRLLVLCLFPVNTGLPDRRHYKSVTKGHFKATIGFVY